MDYSPYTVWDTSVSTRNVGDNIIMEAVLSNLHEIFENRQCLRIPTHNYLTLGSYKCLRESNMSFVGGSNLLSSNMPFYQQWNVNPLDMFFCENIILMGVGWWQYQNNVNFYTKWLLKRLLKNNYKHSVRDSYTENKLKSIGVSNVINTGCPTMWKLTPEHCASISVTKSDTVIFTLTDYAKDPFADTEILKFLRKNYLRVRVWIQGSKDYSYLKSLNADGLYDDIIPPSLGCYDDALKQDCEYVGTRLHAGIRAIQMKRRSLIIAVDNRGIEKGKDFGLSVIKRADLTSLPNFVHSNRETSVRINKDLIDEWKAQFYAA